MSHRYLITGAQGLIGRYLSAHILDVDSDAEVLGIGRSPRTDAFFTHAISGRDGPKPGPVPPELLSNLPDRYRYERVALQDTGRLRAVIRAFAPDCVFHLASALHTASVGELAETNVEGTASVVDAIDDRETLLVLGSSGSVYGNPASLPIHERETCAPADFYGVTKLAAEHIARIGAARRGFTVITGRIFNVVGPGQSEAHVCARLAAQIARGGPVHVGPLDPTRDFIDVRDVAAGLLALAERGERGRTYNLGSGRETSIGAVLSELLHICGDADVEIVRRNDHPTGVKRHFADVSRLAALGFAPAYPLAHSLRDLLAYYQARPEPASEPLRSGCPAAAG